jgi:MOSC domain-containing protein YiiM
MAGQVIELHIAAHKDAPAQAQTALALDAGHGIKGDRYFLPQQSLDMDASVRRKEEVTLISADELDAFNTQFQLAIPYGEFRRNIVTRNINLNALVGKRFRIGSVLCEGMELCEPCSKLARTVNRLVLPHLVHRAGIRATVIESGQVVPGDTIEETTDL